MAVNSIYEIFMVIIREIAIEFSFPTYIRVCPRSKKTIKIPSMELGKRQVSENKSKPFFLTEFHFLRTLERVKTCSFVYFSRVR